MAVIALAAPFGLMIGLIVGTVGGGFVIVPVLTIGFKLPFRRAVATSLFIITSSASPRSPATSRKARTCSSGSPSPLAATGAGAVLGTLIGGPLPQHVLGRAFSVVVALVAVFLLVDTLAFHGPPGS